MTHPRVALTMIVRDEAHVIERCIDSVRPVIDCWAIVDTGSVDGTQDVVRRALADLPGALIERPWVDFAHNRTEALEHARTVGADYALMIDADDVLEIARDFDLPHLDAPGYWMDIVVGTIRVPRIQLMRLDLPWRYAAAVHEYATMDRTPAIDAVVGVPGIGGLRMRTHHDGARWQNRAPALEGDVAALERMVAEDPTDGRALFYLGQTLAQLGRHAAARDAHLRSVAHTAWPAQAYFARLAAARMLIAAGADLGVAAAELDALVEEFPGRAEAIVERAHLANASGDPSLALSVLAQSDGLRASDDTGFFVEVDAYGPARDLEYAVAALATGDPMAALTRGKAAADHEDASPLVREAARQLLVEALAGVESTPVLMPRA